MTLHIHVVPEHEVRRRPDRVRWCFVCRKRVQFDLVVKAPIDVMSYYGPRAELVCERGHTDGNCFPGTWNEWEER